MFASRIDESFWLCLVSVQNGSSPFDISVNVTKMGLFGKSQERNPKEMVRSEANVNNCSIDLLYRGVFQVQEWTHKIRKEGYQLDRQVRGKPTEDNAQLHCKTDNGICTQRFKEKRKR